MAADRIRIIVDVDVEPDVDNSSFQIATVAVLCGLHGRGLYPDRFVLEMLGNGHAIAPLSAHQNGRSRA